MHILSFSWWLKVIAGLLLSHRQVAQRVRSLRVRMVSQDGRWSFWINNLLRPNRIWWHFMTRPYHLYQTNSFWISFSGLPVSTWIRGHDQTVLTRVLACTIQQHIVRSDDAITVCKYFMWTTDKQRSFRFQWHRRLFQRFWVQKSGKLSSSQDFVKVWIYFLRFVGYDICNRKTLPFGDIQSQRSPWACFP